MTPRKTVFCHPWYHHWLEPCSSLATSTNNFNNMTCLRDHQKKLFYLSHFEKLKTLRSSFFTWTLIPTEPCKFLTLIQCLILLTFTKPSTVHQSLYIQLFSEWFFYLFSLRPDSLLCTLFPVILPQSNYFFLPHLSGPLELGQISSFVFSLWRFYHLAHCHFFQN